MTLHTGLCQIAYCIQRKQAQSGAAPSSLAATAPAPSAAAAAGSTQANSVDNCEGGDGWDVDFSEWRENDEHNATDTAEAKAGEKPAELNNKVESLNQLN